MARIHMQTGPLVPWTWLAVLEKVQRLGCPAAIAGGAVRDLLNNRQARDVDIWTFGDQDETTLRGYAEHEGWEVVTDFGSYGELGETLRTIYKFSAGGVEFNVIVTAKRNIVEVLERFDFGICQAAITTTGDPESPCHISVTDAYLEDLEAQVFKVRHDHGAARSLKRYVRLVEKYPGWDYEAPSSTLNAADPFPM